MNSIEQINPENAKSFFTTIISVWNSPTPLNVIQTCLIHIARFLESNQQYISDCCKSTFLDNLPIYHPKFALPSLDILLTVSQIKPENFKPLI
jgi:hypothetical protein